MNRLERAFANYMGQCNEFLHEIRTGLTYVEIIEKYPNYENFLDSSFGAELMRFKNLPYNPKLFKIKKEKKDE